MVNNAGLGSFSVSSDPWGYGSFMGGLFVNFPSDKLDIDLRGLIGFGYGMAPEMTISGYDIDGSYAVIWQKSATAYAFAFDIGAGLRYHVSRLICLNLLLDYMASQPSFEIDMFINNEYLGASTFDQPMNHITLTAGVGFRLK